MKNFLIIFLILILSFSQQAFAKESTKRHLYSFYNTEKQELSIYINGYIRENNHFYIRNYPEVGFFYFQPNRFPLSKDEDYMFVNVKQIKNDSYMLVKSNRGSDEFRKALLYYLQKNGFKFFQEDDEYMINKVEKDGYETLENYYSSWKDDKYDPNIYKISMTRYVGYKRKEKVDTKDSIIIKGFKKLFVFVFKVATLKYFW